MVNDHDTYPLPFLTYARNEHEVAVCGDRPHWHLFVLCSVFKEHARKRSEGNADFVKRGSTSELGKTRKNKGFCEFFLPYASRQQNVTHSQFGRTDTVVVRRSPTQLRSDGSISPAQNPCEFDPKKSRNRAVLRDTPPYRTEDLSTSGRGEIVFRAECPEREVKI